MMNENNTTISLTDLEQNSSNAPLAKEKIKGLDTPCSIHIHSIRKRLADSDGISGKAVIDGIVHAGLLPDDSAKYIKEVSFSQEKGKEEITIIEIK